MTSYTDALRRLSRLAQLPYGWDYGADGPPTAKAITGAFAALYSMNFLSAKEYEVLPGHENGVTVVAVNGELAAEVHINSDGSFNLVHETAGEENYSLDNVSLEALTCKLEELGWPSTRLFVSCTQAGTAKAWAAILPSHSARGVMDASPLFAPNASLNWDLRYANILRNITNRESQERLQSSGEYKQLPFQVMSA